MAFLAIGQMAAAAPSEPLTEQNNLQRLPRSLLSNTRSLFTAMADEGEVGSYGYGR